MSQTVEVSSEITIYRVYDDNGAEVDFKAGVDSDGDICIYVEALKLESHEQEITDLLDVIGGLESDIVYLKEEISRLEGLSCE